MPQLAHHEDLIIDVGMHTGKDTRFYLQKGFRVVGIEANPDLVQRVKTDLAAYTASGQLTVIHAAINTYNGEAEFHINQDKDEWGTLSDDLAAKHTDFGTIHKTITVPSRTFGDILRDTGIPYYLKIDIEGYDMLCVEALKACAVRPPYLSLEISLGSFAAFFDELATLWSLGYRQFKLVNQRLNPTVSCPYPPREGQYVDQSFDFEMSGPFGDEAPGVWTGVEDIVTAYRRIAADRRWFGPTGRLPLYGEGKRVLRAALRKLVYAYWAMIGKGPVGWYDLHAKLGM